MIVVLDLNIALDVLLARKEFLESAEVILIAEEGMIDALIPLHGITTIYYFCRKEMSDEKSRQQLSKLLDAVSVFSISEDEVRRAIASPIPDFEDAIVFETARMASADYIITRNVRDFALSVIPAITTSQFLDLYFPSI